MPQPDETSLLGRERALDRLCDQFEQACKANHFPRIEDYLAQARPRDHDALLRELILLEVAYRRKNGLAVNLHEYRQRFPRLDLQPLSSALETPRVGDAANPTPGEDSASASESTGASVGSAPDVSAPTKLTKIDAKNDSSHPSTGNFAQRIRCPHCQNPIVLLDDRPDEVLCPGCGSSFRLRDARHTDTTTGPRPLGKFQLLDRVGVGAFGAVWRARDTELDRIVALKIPHSGLLIEKDELERFHREARAAAQLRHPGIVTVHEVVTLEGLPTIVSDFVAGVPLKDLLETRKLTFRESAKLVAQIAEALHYAHTRGLVHRDIKPANIMLERGQGSAVSSQGTGRQGLSGDLLTPRILDFGLALRTEAEVTMTLDGHIIGTPAYMSPEQAAGKSHEADERSDVYSLGVVLYELLCGELPFRGSKLMILQQVLWEDPRPPRKLKDRVPRDLETICLKCLCKEPEKRYGTARLLAADLEHFLNGEPIQARPIGSLERGWRWCRRRPLLAGLWLSVIVLLLSITGVSVAGFVKVSAANRLVTRTNSNLEEARTSAERNGDQARQGVDLASASMEQTVDQIAHNPQLAEFGFIDLRRGLLAPAVKFYDDLVKLKSDDRQLEAKLHNHLLALRSLEDALFILRELADEAPDNVSYQRSLIEAWGMISSTYDDLDQPDESRRALTEAMNLAQRHAGQFKALPDSRLVLARAYLRLAVWHFDNGRAEEAMRYYTASLALFEGLTSEFPSVGRYQWELGQAFMKFSATQKPVVKLAYAEKAVDCFVKAKRLGANLLQIREGLCQARILRANCLALVGRSDEAVRAFEKAMKEEPEFAKGNQLMLESCRLVARAQLARTVTKARAGKHAEAAIEANRVIEMRTLGAVVSLTGSDPATRLLASQIACSIAQRDGPIGETYFNAACVFAICTKVSKASELAELYRNRAMVLLMRADEEGFFNEPGESHYIDDADLTPLHSLAAFQDMRLRIKRSGR